MRASPPVFLVALLIGVTGLLRADPIPTANDVTRQDAETEHRLREALETATKTAQDAPSPSHALAEAEAATQLADLLNHPTAIVLDHANPTPEELANLRSRSAPDPKREAEKEQLYRRALDLYDKTFGPDSTDEQRKNHLKAIENVMWLVRGKQQFAEAEPLFKRAVVMMERHPGLAVEPTVSLADRRCNWAWLLQRLKRNDEAEAQYRKAIEEDDQDPRPTESKALHLSMFYPLLDAVGKHDEALKLCLQTLAIDEQPWEVDRLKSSGIAGLGTIRQLQTLAVMFSTRERYDVSEILLRRVVALYGARKAGVPLRPVENLIFVLIKTNRPEASAKLSMNVFKFLEEKNGPNSQLLPRFLHMLAFALSRSGKTPLARTLYERELSILTHPRAEDKDQITPPAAVAKLKEDFTTLLQNDFKVPPDQIPATIAAAEAAPPPTEKITPELEKAIGPTQTLVQVIQELDQQDQAAKKPAIYTWPLDQPIAPELSHMLATEPKKSAP